ncbi:hypothetical protein BDQ17DRAFT_1176465, partial [Cyathus striatus]
IIGQLQHLAPTIFKVPSSDGSLFVCSDNFVNKFLHRSLGWTLRKSTRAGRKIPNNADEVLRKAFLRMVHIIKVYDIPSPALIVNGDQTQVVLS